MLVLGVNNGNTSYGKPLKDGGAALVSEKGIIGAISEERLTGVKGCGGFTNSVRHLLSANGILINNIDTVVYSSCCECNPSIEKTFNSLGYNNQIIAAPSHHYSHAASVFYTSGFDKALIIVMDSGGNVLDEMQNNNNWWEYKREQQTYFLGQDSKLIKIGSDFEAPYDAGIGEIYRAFTKFLGWNTKYSGKVMSLAGLDYPNAYGDNQIFNMNNGVLSSCIKNSPLEPKKMLDALAKVHNINIGLPREYSHPINQEHIQLAKWIQSEYERIICSKINYLCSRYQISKICLTGGVALNCVANSKILSNSRASELYIQPAAGDQGQCLGNAIIGIKNNTSKTFFNGFSPFLAPPITIKEKEITQNDIFIQNKYCLFLLQNPEATIATLLYENNLVGHFYGRGEFGPRALGHRSIFASPIDSKTKLKLNSLKKREDFNPFACTILTQYYNEWFHNSATESPFMLLAERVREDKRYKIPAVVHSDGTSRVQTISKENCPRVHEILIQFNNISKIPLLLNTSLNSNNQPICESVVDAITAFKELSLDYLIINNYVIMNQNKAILLKQLISQTSYIVRIE